MLSNKDKIYKEIKTFISKTIDDEIVVVNSAFMTNIPSTTKRVEFQLANFNNLSHNYRSEDTSGTKIEYKVESYYKADLIIRVIATPEQANRLTGVLSNALQMFEYRDMFMPSLSILNHTLRQHSIPVKEDGTIFNLNQIIVDCNMVLPFSAEFDYFDSIEDVDVNIKEK